MWQEIGNFFISAVQNPIVQWGLGLLGLSSIGGLIFAGFKLGINYLVSVNNVDKFGDYLKKKLKAYSIKQPKMANLLARKVVLICTEIKKDMESFLDTGRITSTGQKKTG